MSVCCCITHVQPILLKKKKNYRGKEPLFWALAAARATWPISLGLFCMVAASSAAWKRTNPTDPEKLDNMNCDLKLLKTFWMQICFLFFGILPLDKPMMLQATKLPGDEFYGVWHTDPPSSNQEMIEVQDFGHAQGGHFASTVAAFTYFLSAISCKYEPQNNSLARIVCNILCYCVCSLLATCFHRCDIPCSSTAKAF